MKKLIYNLFSKKSYFLLFVLSILFFTSCQTEEFADISSHRILRFESDEEYRKEVDKIRNLSEDEKKQYLESKGFHNSFAVRAMEVYEKLDIESKTSFAEVEEYVKNNSRYLTLTLDESSGEYFLETKLMNAPERYFVNEDHIFQIGENVFKVFDDKTLATDRNNLNEIKSIVRPEDFDIEERPGIFVSKFHNTQSFSEEIAEGRLDNTYNCGNNEKVDREDSGKGRDRTYIRLNVFAERPYSDVPWAIRSSWIIRPYKRTLGVWYFASRTITGNLKARVDFISDGDNSFPALGDWVRRSYSDCFINTISPTYAYENGDILGYWISQTNPYNAVPTFHFAGYDFWGDTPSVSLIPRVQCNVSILSCN